jgi:hypothetical protein
MYVEAMNTRTLEYVLIGIAVIPLIFATCPLLSPVIVQSQEEGDEDDGGGSGGEATTSPSATIVNSKYLTLSGVTYTENDNQVTMAGNISNISPDQSFTNVVIIGQLYDQANMLIAATTGVAGLANLQPGQQSAFTMTTSIPSEDEVARYTVLPGGAAG